MFRTLALVAAFIAAFFTTGLSAQGVPCGPKDPSHNLLELHNETPLVVAMTSRNALMTVYASPKGSWSLIVFLPSQNIFCMIDNGDQIEIIPSKSKKK